jgi:sterol desaturase/sphingolipid hydroxylase (fatty acid hydroxylase superfamily)
MHRRFAPPPYPAEMRKGPAPTSGALEGNQYKMLAVALTLLAALLPALLTTMLAALAGVLGLLAGPLLAAALLLTGLLLAALLLAALVRVLRILAHRVLHGVPALSVNNVGRQTFPRCRNDVVTIPPTTGATF